MLTIAIIFNKYDIVYAHFIAVLNNKKIKILPLTKFPHHVRVLLYVRMRLYGRKSIYRCVLEFETYKDKELYVITYKHYASVQLQLYAHKIV